MKLELVLISLVTFIKVAFLSQAGHMLHLIVEAWLASDVLPGANVMYSE